MQRTPHLTCLRPCLGTPTRRYMDFMTEHLKEVCNYDLKPELRGELETAILHLEVRHGWTSCRMQITDFHKGQHT